MPSKKRVSVPPATKCWAIWPISKGGKFASRPFAIELTKKEAVALHLQQHPEFRHEERIVPILVTPLAQP